MATLRSIPLDLTVVALYVVAAAPLLQFASMPRPVRAVVGTPLLLFVPGYALAAAAYPMRYDGDGGEPFAGGVGGRLHRGLHPVERMVLAVGLSVALVPLVGVLVWAAFGSFSRPIVLASLAGFVLLVVPVGVARRFDLPPDRRLAPRPADRARAFKGWLLGSSALDAATNVLLVGGILVAAVTLTYAFAVPVDGESYTNAILLSEQGGEFRTANYPSTFVAGEPRSLTLQLANHEGSRTTYSVVVAVERVEGSGSDIAVVEQSVLDRFEVTLRPGETVRREHAVAPDLTGEDLRLSYYVYAGEAPTVPDDASAYRDLHLWISVQAA